jgi:predicted CxxxxCH...CXXCH cytochrome family protein
VTSCSARAVTIRARPPTAFAVTRSVPTAGILTQAVGRARAARTRRCAGTAMVSALEWTTRWLAPLGREAGDRVDGHGGRRATAKPSASETECTTARPFRHANRALNSKLDLRSHEAVVRSDAIVRGQLARLEGLEPANARAFSVQLTRTLTARTLFALALLCGTASCLERRTDPAEATDVGRCATCHGDPTRAGDVVSRAAPPRDLSGGTDPSFPGVGAHTIHLNASSTHAAIACSECHIVPERSDSPGHADHGSPATLVFGSLASAGGHTPSYDSATRSCSDSYCHGDSGSVWNAPRSSAEACGSCHGLPPPAPHPQSSRCSLCHGAVVDAARNFIAPELHVNGQVDVATPDSCTACHGGVNPAPPLDLAGNTTTSSPGVGAHQAHLLGSASARAVPCAECHLVPKHVLDPGHIDGDGPAEVIFSGAATAFGASPTYGNGMCQSTACHGGTFPDGNPSGGTNTTPIWTLVDGTQARCGTCHALPPPAPHPYLALNPVCSACHEDIAPDNKTFVRPDLHVDGIVTFNVP